MKVYVCTDHAGHLYGGVASVIVAKSEEEARELLKDELKSVWLDHCKPFTLHQIKTNKPLVEILQDGN